MKSTYDLISHIPAYMIELISSQILGNPADTGRLAEGLSDDKRLRKILEALGDKPRSLLMDLFELGGQVQWDVLAHLYGDELDEARQTLSLLGKEGIVFQGGLTGRDPLILLPSVNPLLDAVRQKQYKPVEDLAWNEPKRLDVWGHMALINTVRSTRIRCRSGMEPFKRGWEFLEEKLGDLIDLKRIYWELVDLGCFWDKKGVVTVAHNACTDLAIDGDARYPLWRFVQTCKPYPGIEIKVVDLLGEKALARDFLSRALVLFLVSRTPEVPEARQIIAGLVDLWIGLGVLQEDTLGTWIRFTPGVSSGLKAGRLEVPLQSYAEEVIIQPNMEILVPKDFDPVDILNIGEIADVVLCDVVSIYRLTRKSVFRALHEGWNAGKIENFLDRISRHEVPDNVIKTVAGWSRSHSEAHIITGTFLVLPDAPHKAPQGLEEILPGIFRIPEKCGEEVRAFLDKRDVMVRGVDLVWDREEEGGINWGKMMPVEALARYQTKAVRKEEGVYPFGMVAPLPYGSKGEVVFEEALHVGKSLIIFYPRQGYGEIQVKKISPVYIYRKGGAAFVEAFCEDTGEGEIFEISKVRALFKEG